MANDAWRNETPMPYRGSRIEDPGSVAAFGMRHSSLTMAPATDQCPDMAGNLLRRRLFRHWRMACCTVNGTMTGGTFLNHVRGGARLGKANFFRLGSPLKINLCVTYWCQYRCKTCNIWQRKPTDELSTDELLRFFSKNRSVSWLDLTGGEPFLRKDFGTVLEAALAECRHLAVVHFPTNGFLTDRIVATAERLPSRTSARVIITVSLDGDEELNDEI